MEFSNINWTDHTWNPWIGCRHVSAECDHCYADFLVSKRMGKDFGAVTRTKTWRDPIRWNARATELQEKLGRRVRVFCASLTDFFIQDADEWRDEAWKVIRECANLDFLILTKRPRLIPSRLPADWGNGYPNVWLGTTCGVRSSYPRIDDLRKVPAAVRFISAEPLLESLHDIDLAGIHWLIAGGESGSKFRTMKDEWALELRDHCHDQGVAFHFKQHSAFRPGTDPLLGGVKYHESPLVQINAAGTAARADEGGDLPISPGERVEEHISELSADFKAEEQL
jgi:protein gp37